MYVLQLNHRMHRVWARVNCAHSKDITVSLLHPYLPRDRSRCVRQQRCFGGVGLQRAAKGLRLDVVSSISFSCLQLVTGCLFRLLTLDASSNLDLYTASDHLPSYLLGANGHSYSVEKTAWQSAIGTTKPRWDWLEEEVSREEASAHGPGYPGVPAGDVAFKDHPPGTKLRRPEHEIFSLAMVGGGRIFGAAHPYGECIHLH